MKAKQGILIMALVVFGTVPSVYAIPSVEIVMEKTTYNYCEKLFYTIRVSEITGDPAILHITDQAGKGSSAIPIPISNLETPIPSVMPFEAEIFPPGKYTLDVEYSGGEDTISFDLLDSENVCISTVMKQFAFSWINNQISDGFFIDAINKFVDKKVINISDNISEKNLQDIHIPSWVKNVVAWWLEEKISDGEAAKAIQYLINKEIIVI
ncbi:MAG: hypothetical protein RI100_06635 [Nitrosarchaeum sp.]|jgi:hypothetical protein|uniref:hypothetical protein n=1 Tax=Nitrosarchaeum sp. TaxID=2026886 RepID=UPI002DF45266|nr:hypothetical protein [Nitrosarchaeum sp.]